MGTARNPAAAHWFSPQPSNFDGTLSYQDEPPGPPGTMAMSLSRKDRSTAFFSHWCTVQLSGPLAPSRWVATRSSPESSSDSARSTASRTSPVVPGVMVARSSKARSMMA